MVLQNRLTPDISSELELHLVSNPLVPARLDDSNLNLCIFLRKQARNKPADGSSHLKQREKTPTPGHKGGQAKATAHSAKNPPPGKHGSISISKTGSLSKAPSSGDRDLYLPPPPKPGARNKKNKKKTYELYVKIDIVSSFLRKLLSI